MSNKNQHHLPENTKVRPAYAHPDFPDKASGFSQDIRPKNGISAGNDMR